MVQYTSQEIDFKSERWHALLSGWLNYGFLLMARVFKLVSFRWSTESGVWEWNGPVLLL